MRRAALLVILILLPVIGSPVGRVLADAIVPTINDFNRYVMAVVESYPTDGTHGYHWPRGSSWAGTTMDLVYRGETIAEGDEQGRCYCCGLTFEAFFRAWEGWCSRNRQPFIIGELDGAGVRRLRTQWFGSDGDRRTLQNAIVSNGLGQEIEPADAAPGDFVQFWRHSGSGHSVVFIDWQRDGRGTITGLRYWSTQSSTDGIDYRTEPIGEPGIIEEEIYIARVGIARSRR